MPIARCMKVGEGGMSNLSVKYKTVEPSRIKGYLLKLLGEEWGSLKGEDYDNIKKVKWSIRSLGLDEIILDQNLLNEPRFKKDIQRRVRFQKNKILRGEPIRPLVVMYKDKYLIDGYARFLAFKELGVKEAKVYFGVF